METKNQWTGFYMIGTTVLKELVIKQNRSYILGNNGDK